MSIKETWNVVIAVPSPLNPAPGEYHRLPLPKGQELKNAFELASTQFDVECVRCLVDPQDRIVGLDLYTNSLLSVHDMLHKVNDFTRDIIGEQANIEICAITDASPQAVYL